MSFTNWMENKVLNHIFSKGTYSPQVIHVGLCSGSPGEAATGGSCNEVPNANGYARQSTSSASWNTSSNSEITNALVIIFPEAYPNGWGTVAHFALFNSGSYGGGSVLLYAALPSPVSMPRGSRPRFDPGTLKVGLNGF